MQKNYNNIYINERKILNEWVHVNKKIEILKKNLSSFAPKLFFFTLYIWVLIRSTQKKFQVVSSKNKRLIKKFQKKWFHSSSAASVHLS